MNVGTPQNIRNYCFDVNIKEYFWAKNTGYSWGVTDYWGTAQSQLGACADYNDLSDLCRTQSIAIGLRYPKWAQGADILGSGIEINLDISILAPRGNAASSSKITGNVQAVSDRHCNAYPNMSYTDCMGVFNIAQHWGGYPSGNYNRATLGASRNAVAPGWCWRTWNKGGNYEKTSC